MPETETKPEPQAPETEVETEQTTEDKGTEEFQSDEAMPEFKEEVTFNEAEEENQQRTTSPDDTLGEEIDYDEFMKNNCKG